MCACCTATQERWESGLCRLYQQLADEVGRPSAATFQVLPARRNNVETENSKSLWVLGHGARVSRKRQRPSQPKAISGYSTSRGTVHS